MLGAGDFTPHTQIRTVAKKSHHSNQIAISQIVALDNFEAIQTSAMSYKRTNNAAATEPPPSPPLDGGGHQVGREVEGL